MGRLLIGGEWVEGASSRPLTDKYDGKVYGEMGVASDAQVTLAVTGAEQGQEESTLTPYERSRILLTAAGLVTDRAEALIELMRHEAGFTRADGANEVRRCVQTLELCAQEAKGLIGEMVPMQAAEGVGNRIGFTMRAPLGVVCAITPFNSPLNGLAHKIGPALAGGNSVVMKPAGVTPLTAVHLCQILIDAGLPPNLLALVHGPGDVIGPQLLADQRIAFYAFTGSTDVGREIRTAAGLRRTQLELGSIASTIVCHDADIELAVRKIVNAGFRKAGQVCTSVQRLYVDRTIAPEFIPRLVAAAEAMKAGDPADPTVLVGPMISERDAERAKAWVDEAVVSGSRLLTGGGIEGSVMQPTVLAGVTAEMNVVCKEIFAPVISVIEFDSFEEAVAAANDSPYGLSAGVFTRSLHTALAAGNTLRFGGIHVNEASSARVDVMPFGGVKDSGVGFEGPAYAIREMTEERLLTISW